MNWLTDLFQDLPIYLLSLPVLLMAFSVHETMHGYMAYKLGDPTARNLGRLSLNPIKHIDPIGFICMLLFHVGWAKPVPVTARNFKNPRRDMALTGAAGPVSNLLLAIVHLALLRLLIPLITPTVSGELSTFMLAVATNQAFRGSVAFTLLSLTVYLLYLGVIMNVSLAIFNLIPIPPFDGSRIFYAFLPPRLYFGVMRYERTIMMIMFILLAFGFLTGPLSWLLNLLVEGLFYLFGFPNTQDMTVLNLLLTYIDRLLTLPL